MTRAFDDAVLPDWPLYLSREEAARYVGVSPNTFDHEVGLGLWPAPVKRGERGGRVTWYRPAIEKVAAAREGGEQDERSFERWRDRLPKGRENRKEAAR